MQLTHFQPMFNFYTPWKPPDVFKGHKNETLVENGLNSFLFLMLLTQ